MRSVLRCVSPLFLLALAFGAPARLSGLSPDWFTYLGGSDLELVEASAADAAGNLYVTGWTRSADFPGMGSAGPGDEDVFVTKLSPSGALIWSTWLGGSGLDMGWGLAVDAQGNVYVTGVTDSPDFPRLNPLPPQLEGRLQNAFVAKLDPNGSPVYSTLLGGGDLDRGLDVAVDAQGSAWVVGHTYSGNFPRVQALQAQRRGFVDVFVSRLSPDGSSLLFSTYLGGTSQDWGEGIGIDAAGDAWITGSTASADFPVAGLPSSYGGSFDAFVAKIRPSGSQGPSLAWSRFLGGADGDSALDLAVDSAGHAWVTGVTGSTDFPTLNPLQPSRAGISDVFVTRLDPAGSLEASTYLGGSGIEQGWSIAVDGAGSPFVTGFTTSADFPLQDPIKPGCTPPGTACGPEIFVARLDPAGTDLVFSSFLGGSAENGGGGGTAVAASPAGDAWVAGWTTSPALETVNAFQPAFAGGYSDGFVLRLGSGNQPPDCSAASASPDLLWPPDGKLRAVSIGGVTDPDGEPVTLAVTRITQDEPLSKKGQPDATGTGTARPMLRADRAGGGDGRVYHLTFTASDPAGAACTGRVTVCVPHSPGRRICGDGGPRFDSTGSAP